MAGSSAGYWTWVSSQTATASGNSGPLQIAVTPPIATQITVTAVSGTTPSIAFSVQWSTDGVNFGPPDGGGDTWAAITAAGTVTKLVTPKGQFMKILWTVSGTSPSFTFSLIASE